MSLLASLSLKILASVIIHRTGYTFFSCRCCKVCIWACRCVQHSHILNAHLQEKVEFVMNTHLPLTLCPTLGKKGWFITWNKGGEVYGCCFRQQTSCYIKVSLRLWFYTHVCRIQYHWTVRFTSEYLCIGLHIKLLKKNSSEVKEFWSGPLCENTLQYLSFRTFSI